MGWFKHYRSGLYGRESSRGFPHKTPEMISKLRKPLKMEESMEVRKD